MNHLSRVLVAVDTSEPARAAFEQALAISMAHDAELVVVHAVPPDQPFRWRARERAALLGALRRSADAAGVRVSASVQHGDAAGVILLHASSKRPDLIVVGTHRRTGMDRLRAGSVAERVTLGASQPVLVVPAREGVSASPAFDRVVVAVDFSTASSQALERALSIVRRTNGRVTAVHVLEKRSPAGRSAYNYHFDVPEYERALARDAWQRLQDAVGRAPDSSQVHARVLNGDPSTEIARVAADTAADLIVVGVTSRGAFARRVFAATAARVIRAAGRPVLAVPERSRRQAPPPSELGRQRLAA